MKQKYSVDFDKKTDLSLVRYFQLPCNWQGLGEGSQKLSSLQDFLDVMKFPVRDLET